MHINAAERNECNNNKNKKKINILIKQNNTTSIKKIPFFIPYMAILISFYS